MLDAKQVDTAGKVGGIVARVARQHDIRREIAPTDHLVDCGLTSMAMVDLMLAIEAEFDVTIPQREMTPANFRSIASLACMLDRL